jgi:hypothetical protein
VVNRIQTLRSSTPGARPAGRQPGELYVNWPDLQLGVVDSTSAPVDLIAVRYFSTLTAYAVGDFVIQVGALYVANSVVAPGPFNPAQWTAMKTVLDPPVGGPYLPLAGGTLTGPLDGASVTLSGTLSGVNATFQGIIQSMREQITNVAGTARSLTGATSLNPRWQMNFGDATPESGANAGSNFALLAYADDGSTLLSTPLAINRASGATTIANLSAPQAIGDNRIINGNFAVNQRGQVSGTALAAAAYGHDRWKAGAAGCTYTFTAAIPDTTITITVGTLTQIIEADMIEGGVYTLSWTGTAQARVYQGAPAGAYAASPITTAALPAGVNTVIEFNAGTAVRVKFEAGTVATPFNRQSLGKSLADCQRYYQQTSVINANTNSAGVTVDTSTPFVVGMRASPTLVIANNNNFNMGAPTLNATLSFWWASAIVTAGGAYTMGLNVHADAEL